MHHSYAHPAGSSLRMVLVLVAAALALTACIEDTTPEGADVAFPGEPAAESGYATAELAATHYCGDGLMRFIRITQRGRQVTVPLVDAVRLVKPDEDYHGQIVFRYAGPSDPHFSEVQGPPDSVSSDLTLCDPTMGVYPIVSDGFVTLSVANDIEIGDEIVVFEASNCSHQGVWRPAAPYRLEIGSHYNGPFVEVGVGAGSQSFIVTQLPETGPPVDYICQSDPRGTVPDDRADGAVCTAHAQCLSGLCLAAPMGGGRTCADTRYESDNCSDGMTASVREICEGQFVAMCSRRSCGSLSPACSPAYPCSYGASCHANEDCSSGLCFKASPHSEDAGVCTKTCFASADCGGALQACNQVDNPATDPIYICTP